MVMVTRENSRKAWDVADFLNNIGYFSRFFFQADDVLKICHDENELRWWYQKILKDEGKLK